MHQPGETTQDRRRRRTVIVLTVVAVVLWVVAVALATLVLVLIARLPGSDPDRTARGLVIAAGAFTTFALPAVGATIGAVSARLARARDTDM
ncbi:hypothetical protein [Curtobacterium sp. ZW137]|uniref:hypothetical protein n=1 Tax=Curtobacterium sp. ZW137 TaxID=2485104 RepID=UPI000F4BBF20|nr:hypothetical protein [Curtobacterium sp. ZW137]ROP60881.1 hypothetical protein EDF55_2882 [Curtobacterium sp. ZW137]